MKMEREFIEAIQNLKCLIIDYPPGRRVVEPHAFGRSNDGHLLLRAYQTEGASASGEHEHWKLFRDACAGGFANRDDLAVKLHLLPRLVAPRFPVSRPNRLLSHNSKLNGSELVERPDLNN